LSANLSRDFGGRTYLTGLKCVSCGAIYSPEPKFFICPKCGIEKVEGISVFRGQTDAQYDYTAIADCISKELLAGRPFNALRYKELLGLSERPSIVTLGEGGTSLVKCKRLAKRLGLRNLWLKNEAQNPTHSFKDRESLLAVNKAWEFGKKYVSCVSSGNAAASLAAYAARASLGCYVFMPAKASKAKVSQCAVYGATTLLMEGIYEEIFELYIEALRGLDILESSAGHNRFRTEGDKTIAYEICEQLGWRSPDWIMDNVGNGTHLYGMWKGFKELSNLGLLEDAPRMMAVGPEAGSPIVKGFKERRVLPLVSSGESVAEGLVGRWGYDAVLAVEALKDSTGCAEYVSDKEILDAVKWLARFEGLFVEPSGAACVAGLFKMIETGTVDRQEEIVCIITGSGLKDPESAATISKRTTLIEPSVNEIRKALKSKH